MLSNGKDLETVKKYCLRNSVSSNGASGTQETDSSLRKVNDWLDRNFEVAESSLHGQKRKRRENSLVPSATSSVDLTLEQIEEILDEVASEGELGTPTESSWCSSTSAGQIVLNERERVVFEELLPGAIYDNVKAMLKTFMASHIDTFGTKTSAFLHAAQRRYALVGYKMPAIDIPWNQYAADDCIVRWGDVLYALKDLTYTKHDLLDKKNQKNTYMQNVIGILYGDMLTIPGERLQDRYVRDLPRFYFQSSVCVNDKSQGLYLDVSRTEYAGLHRQVSAGPSNCEIISVYDTRLEAEVLLLSLTDDCKQGQPLILQQLHRHAFILQQRAPSKKIKWFSSFKL